MHHVDCADSVARGQNAVKGAGRASTLDVPQHDGAGFETGALLDLAGEQISYSAKPGVPELVPSQVLYDGLATRAVHIAGELSTFCGDHDAEVASSIMACT